MRATLIAVTLVVTAAGSACAVDSGPVAAPPPRATAPAAPAPETLYNEGHELARKQDWKAAEAAYRDALHGRAAFPEAWNGLGYVLRHQGRYDESVRAYQEALRLRPDYAAALEYLGEAYVKLGRMEDARGLLERLRALNAPEAVELAKSISAAYTGQPGAAAPARRW